MFDKMSLANGLKYFRELRGYSREELSGDFLSAQTLKNAEFGRTNLNLTNLLYVSHQLQVPLDDIVYFDTYLLLQQFDQLKTNCLTLITAHDIVKLKDFQQLITNLQSHLLSVERQHEVSIYQLTVEYALSTLADEILSADFPERLDDCLCQHHFTQNLIELDLLIITLFFRQITKPFSHEFYLQLINHPDYLLIPAIRYNENLHLIRQHHWQKVITRTEYFLTQHHKQSSLSFMAAIYLQLSSAYMHLNDPVQASIHEQHSKQLLAHIKNPDTHRQLATYQKELLKNTDNW